MFDRILLSTLYCEAAREKFSMLLGFFLITLSCLQFFEKFKQKDLFLKKSYNCITIIILSFKMTRIIRMSRRLLLYQCLHPACSVLVWFCVLFFFQHYILRSCFLSVTMENKAFQHFLYLPTPLLV